MNYSVYKFNLDLASIGSQVYLAMKQGDTGRSLFITLSNKGQPYEIEDGCIAVFAAKKPDGNIIFNNCVIENNIIHYEVTPQTSAAVGELACEIQLYKDGKLISSPCFATLVNPAVYPESELIESVTEVNTLAELLSYAQTMLINGGFIPKLSVGSVETLPAGSFATVEITGTGEAPVLNFGIPQGIQGQAEHLIPDTELLVDSTKPVQNRAIALKFAVVEENIADNAAAIATKVGKENGKGLSANDFTDEYKQKLDGIEDGANKFAIEDGAVTAAKIANGAVSQTFTGTLLASGWTTTTWGAYQQLTFAGSGIIAYSSAAAANQHVEVGLNTSAFATNENPTAIEADEAWANIFRAIPLNNGVQFNFKEIPTVDIPVYAWVVNK